jgi:hypothetical protein
MRIKKIKKNNYILTKDNIWVRDFCSNSNHIDINNLYDKESKLWLKNEFENIRKSKLTIPVGEMKYENIIICSDGFGWEEKQKIIGKIPNSLVKIIGTNGSLANWKMVGQKAEIKRVMSFYVINNPYPESLRFLPKSHSYYPNILCSTRTYPEFIDKYKTQCYFYQPSQNKEYSSPPNLINLFLDDYRNSICAAISLSWKLGVKKLLLFCCDDSFSEFRDGSILMENGYYQYPQQIISQNIIDKQLYWLKQSGVEIFNHSSGIKFENAEYINADDILSFFSKECKNE